MYVHVENVVLFHFFVSFWLETKVEGLKWSWGWGGVGVLKQGCWDWTRQPLSSVWDQTLHRDTTRNHRSGFGSRFIPDGPGQGLGLWSGLTPTNTVGVSPDLYRCVHIVFCLLWFVQSYWDLPRSIQVSEHMSMFLQVCPGVSWPGQWLVKVRVPDKQSLAKIWTLNFDTLLAKEKNLMFNTD